MTINYVGGDDISPSQAAIVVVCDEVKELLLAKNREYGDSVINPLNIFSELSADEQINVRIDDKLKRIHSIRRLGKAFIHEDTELDLIGYLVLKRVLRLLEKNDD